MGTETLDQLRSAAGADGGTRASRCRSLLPEKASVSTKNKMRAVLKMSESVGTSDALSSAHSALPEMAGGLRSCLGDWGHHCPQHRTAVLAGTSLGPTKELLLHAALLHLPLKEQRLLVPLGTPVTLTVGQRVKHVAPGAWYLVQSPPPPLAATQPHLGNQVTTVMRQ